MTAGTGDPELCSGSTATPARLHGSIENPSRARSSAGPASASADGSHDLGSATRPTGKLISVSAAGSSPPRRPLERRVDPSLVHESADLALPAVGAEGVRGESADLLHLVGYILSGLALAAGGDNRLHGPIVAVWSGSNQV